MKKIVLRSLLPSLALAASLLLVALKTPWPQYILAAGILFGLYPLLSQVWNELYKNKRIDLGLPIVATIFILIYLDQQKTAGIFVFLILLGGFFKDYIIWKVKRSVEDVSESLPQTALQKTGTETVEIKISDIEKGDIIALKAGARVPVDGILHSESALFDESIVTGESRRISKKNGDRLVAGAINTGGYAEMTASETSANSTIAMVKKLVKEAQSKSAPLSRFTTLYAQVTIAVTLILCAIYYFIILDIVQVLALWIALVPVIFAIIVPVSTTLGISILSKNGILIKSAEALEDLTKIDVIAFDKTGTLTTGNPAVTKIYASPEFGEEKLLRLAASVETYSEHHLGEAVVRKAHEDKILLSPATDLKTARGRGVEGICEEYHIVLGNLGFVTGVNIFIPDEILAVAREEGTAGNSAVFMAADNKFAGAFFIEDATRKNARLVVKELRQKGFAVIMLTGDSANVANKIAKDLGIEDVRAGCLPQDKINHIINLKKESKKVAMIGDGINDAPALAEANVGIAMGLRGTDITLEAAEVIFILDDLAALPKIIKSSRKIFGTIKSSLVIATAIHFVTAGLVIEGSVGILGSTLLHQVSSLLVLLNTSRLFRLGK